MLKCRQVIDLVSKSQDDPLSRLKRWQMKLHLMVCKARKCYLHQTEFIGKATGQGVNHCQNKTLLDNAWLQILEKLKSIKK